MMPQLKKPRRLPNAFGKNAKPFLGLQGSSVNLTASVSPNSSYSNLSLPSL